MSHPPNTKSFKSLNGTNFLISGERASVRLPSRIVLSWVSEPTGCAFPFRTSSTPAINVVLTAPIPGRSTPNLPFGGAILTGLSIPLLLELEFLHSRAHVRVNRAVLSVSTENVSFPVRREQAPNSQ